MPNITDLNGVAVASITDINGVVLANIAGINGLTVSTFSGLLDTYTGAAAAYSVRRLASATTVLLRVRRDTAGGTGDDDEADVAYDTNNVLSLDSAISNASAGVTATTLGQFLNVGTVGGTTYTNPDSLTVTASCFVDEWKDQAGSNDATQATHTAQPKIHSGTVNTDLITKNGQPALDFSSDVLSAPISAYGDGDFSVFVTAAATTDISVDTVVGFVTSGASFNGYALQVVSNAYRANMWRAGVRRDNPAGAYTSTSQGLWSATSDISTDVLNQYLNTVQATSTGSAGAELGQFNIGARNNTATNSPMTGVVQELVLYNSEKNTTDRSGIEGNVNAHYQIGNFGTPTSGLLATYTGAAAAYSVRQLANTAALAMRIREDGTDTETDIGFDANGDLDTAAISSHCGANNGYVVTWYDQSGNQNDATQATTANQPQIYNGASVHTENGKPIIKNNPSSLSYNALVISSQSFTTDNWAFSVNLVDETFSGFIQGPSANDFLGIAQDGVTTSAHNNVSSVVLYKDGASWTATTRDDWYTDLLNNQSLVVANWSSSAWTSFALGYPASELVHINPMQEFILWTTDQSSNRSGIETNINSEYLIYQPTDAPTSGLLATYTGAAAAYSVRQLSDKAVIAMRIRRDSDDAETNIGFDSNGDLDTTAISDFCETANGFVTRWWDQSTNGNHADQATDASQPQIYNGTAVITENGKPSIDFNGVSSRLRTSQLTTVAQPTTRIGVSHFDKVTQPGSGYIQDGHTLRQAVGCDAHTAPDWRLYSGTISDYTEAAAIDTQYLTFGIFDGASSNLSVNGVNLGNKSVGTQGFDGITIGASAGSSTVFMDGGIQEIIVYPNSQSSNRTGIESNINTYFSIY